ncbi:hypothetical protein K4B79_30305 [Streptomyces lincolnensis]|uniref:RICIN domain-containing protein n=1 Tax=Streptomyces lincolnensis TaxID=1915 RepID=UPI001E62494A|nr:hypothetical protein [Streptomyces lincolnensis]MCD7442498.1 hypothetical protein [Streptomyces lincolnensis]
MPDIFASGGAGSPVMFVHEITGTYLETDNYNDNVGEAVQTWNHDPVMTQKGWLGHLWHIEPTGESEVCLLQSYENGRCLTAGATAKDYPRLQQPDGSRKQQWIVRKVHGSEQHAHDADCYALIPRQYPDYALGPQSNYVSNNVYVVPTPMWGGPPSLSQYWKAVLKGEGQQTTDIS